MAKKIRAALVGCGRIASLFAADQKRKGIVTHAQAYLARKDVNLVAACDLDAARLDDFSKRWGVKHTYTDFRDMLREQNPDMVTIATPPSSHFQLAQAAILHGVKIIFCEKPVAAKLSEADELVRLAARKKVCFAVNHSRRWDLLEQKIFRMIHSGKIGKIQTIDGYYTAGIANTGSHLIDLLRMITGDRILSVQAFDNGLTTAQDPTPDVCLRMSGGYQCFLHGLRTESFLMFEIDVYGSKGRLRITQSGFDVQLWQSVPHKQFSGYRHLMPVKHSLGAGYQNVLANALDNILKASQGKADLRSTAEDGRQALEAICGIRESLRNHGKIVELPVNNRNL